MSPQSGDYMVVKTGGWVAWVIRRLTHSPVNHAAVNIGDGMIVEAQPGGAKISSAGNYSKAIWSHLDLDPECRRQIANAALGFVGTPYSTWDIAALAVACVTKKRTPHWIAKRLSRPDRLICSQLVDEAYRRAGVQLFKDRLPSEVTPGDLYNLIVEK